MLAPRTLTIAISPSKQLQDTIATVLQYCLRASRAGRLRSEWAVL